jgi:hypothetical protein
MTSAPQDRYLGLIEQRIALLTSLADALTAARLDVVALDISGLEQRISEQARICTQIRVLDCEVDRLQRQCTGVLSLDGGQNEATGMDTLRFRNLLARLDSVQSTVRRLNNQHQVLLRRSRRTANALLSSYQSFAETYGDSAAVHAIAREGA